MKTLKNILNGFNGAQAYIAWVDEIVEKNLHKKKEKSTVMTYSGGRAYGKMYACEQYIKEMKEANKNVCIKRFKPLPLNEHVKDDPEHQ